jgi:hypothetical protein
MPGCYVEMNAQVRNIGSVPRSAHLNVGPAMAGEATFNDLLSNTFACSTIGPCHI